MLLVTGGTGFIGRHLIKRLVDDGHKIICFVDPDDKRDRSFLNKLKVDIIYCDITRKANVVKGFDKCKDVQAVIHLAAIIKPSPGRDDNEFIEVNVDGTRFLAEECEKRGIKRFVFYSTDFVLYGYPTVYGESKAKAEEILRKSSLEYTILRPTPVYGPGDDKNFNTLFELVRKFPVLPSVRCVMQPVNVMDVVEATVAVLNNDKTYRKEYNLAGGSAVSFAQILRILASEMGKRRLIVPVPGKLMQATVRLYERVVPRPVVRDYQISKWLLNKELSIEDNRNDFGYAPVSFEEGMRETMRVIGVSKRQA